MNGLKTAIFIVSAITINLSFCMENSAPIKKDKIGTYVVTKHFAERMQERKIDKNTIEKALEIGIATPTKKNGVSQIITSIHDRKIKVILAPKTKTLITAMGAKEKRAEKLTVEKQKANKKINRKRLDRFTTTKTLRDYTSEERAFKNRKKINDKIILSATTQLEKNIEDAISKNDLDLTKRLLNLEAPFNSKSKTLANCFMISANLKNIPASNLVLSYVKSPKQIEKVTRDENFKKLEKDSQIRSIFVEKLQTLNAHELLEKIN